jgi:hypothetical protein
LSRSPPLENHHHSTSDNSFFHLPHKAARHSLRRRDVHYLAQRTSLFHSTLPFAPGLSALIPPSATWTDLNPPLFSSLSAWLSEKSGALPAQTAFIPSAYPTPHFNPGPASTRLSTIASLSHPQPRLRLEHTTLSYCLPPPLGALDPSWPT